ncbi:MAG: polyprenyl synthetase family protein [Microbacteriaceae bacterium]|nr:polyprenyl synthetase family protein [Microbacteriaceae bacterium]
MGDDAALLIDAAAQSLRGGKRLRAAFCYWGWRAIIDTRTGATAGFAATLDAAPRQAGETDEADIITVASALEIFQSAALVHDDIIDNSDTRRGQPSSHRALESLHGGNGWAGDGGAFGRAAALLLGDLLVAWSDDLLEQGLEQVTDAAARRRTRAEYATMRRDVTLGQFLDIAEESAFAVSPGEEHLGRALRVASYKSARYSVQQPLTIGGALAGGTDAQLAALAAFGYPIGMAFQLRDDVLGVFGDERLTGKPTGDDLREGKRTALIAITREALAAADRDRLDALLGDPGLTPEQIAALQAMIVETGALDEVERRIDEYAREADVALQNASLGETARDVLRTLAIKATRRSA